MVQAAWQAARAAGRLRAFYERVARRRGTHIAEVAVARKLTVIIPHLPTKVEDYASVRPALYAKKLREFELRFVQPERRGKRGPAYADNVTHVRQKERHRLSRPRRPIDG